MIKDFIKYCRQLTLYRANMAKSFDVKLTSVVEGTIPLEVDLAMQNLKR